MADASANNAPFWVDPEGREYRRVRDIGRGQYGLVSLLQRIGDAHKRVVKAVNLSGLSAAERDAAAREVVILQKLRHPNIIEYIDSFESGEGSSAALNIVMEHADGGTLAERIAEQYGEPLDAGLVRSWFAQLASALAHVHAARVLHRDLKTANVLLHRERIKLSDFGIARPLSTMSEFAKTTIGTPYYLSPEMITGKPYDAKSDVWALGVVLYEVATLERPFQGDNLHVLGRRIVENKPTPSEESAAGRVQPPGVHRLIARCLVTEPAERATLDELLDDECVRELARALSADVASPPGRPTGREESAAATPAPIIPQRSSSLGSAERSAMHGLLSPMASSGGSDAVAGSAVLTVLRELREPLDGARGEQQAFSANLGHTAATPTSTRDGGVQSISWNLITELGHEAVVALALGSAMNGALTQRGAVFTWLPPGAEPTDMCSTGRPAACKPLLRLGTVRALALSAERLLAIVDGGGAAAAGTPGAAGARMPGAGALFEWESGRPLTQLALPLPVALVAAGDDHCAAVCVDGSLFTWGRGECGQLGHGGELWGVLEASVDGLREPTRVEALAPHVVTRVACARELTVVLTEGGECYVCGINDCGQAGEGAGGGGAHDEVDGHDEIVIEPRPVRSDELRAARPRDIACSSTHVAVATSTGHVFTWGDASDGRLGRRLVGLADATHTGTPGRVELRDAWAVACAPDHTLATTGDGALFAWGMIRGVETARPTRVVSGGLADARFVAIAASEWVTCALATVPTPDDGAAAP